MIPIRDSVRSRRRPVVVYLILALNAYVFFNELSMGREIVRFFYEYGLVAARFWRTGDLVERFAPVFTSMFIHAGWLHFGGNMLYLWIFGDNVEDRMGHGRFLAFYLLSGVAAALTQLIIFPNARVPMVGASGAIAGILGAYLRLFPRARVIAMVPFLFFLHLTEVPAAFFLAFWFLIQLFSGSLAFVAPQDGGTAFWAHIGGFVAGFVLGPRFARKPRIEVLPPW